MTDKGAIEALQNIVEYWELIPSLQEVMKQAISALQEREERSKGCVYCNNTEVPEDWTFTCEDSFIVGNYEYIPSGDYYYSFSRKVEFCPICGRPLEGKRNE